MITATGLGSGLDINGLVSQLVAAERSGSDLQLDRRNAKLNSKFSALGSLKGVLASFQSSLTSVNSYNNYSKISANSSVPTELAAFSKSSAIPNNYAIDISQLATSHSLASAAIADSDTTTLGTGSITIRFGTTDYTPAVVEPPSAESYDGFVLNPDSATATINIDGTNNTLEGIMGAINDADVGVSASIVNDGSGFRLLVTSDATGTENSLEVSIDDDDLDDADTSGLSQFAFNSNATNLGQTAAAVDANFTVNGLAVVDSSNTVDSAIPGVTLTLKSVSTSTISLPVATDFSAVKNGINSFLSGYNGFIKAANALSAYDAEKDIPAALTGDFTLRSINGQIDNIVRNSIAGLSGSITNLAGIGITTTSTGELTIDNTILDAALAANPIEVAQLFAAVGVPTDADITYTSSSSATETGDYAVVVTTLATAGVHTGAGVLPDFPGAGTLLIDADNDEITFEIDGIDIGSITLTPATYTTGTDLADEIQARINGTTAMRDASKTVDVVYDSGSNSFSITSAELGSESTVNVLAVDTNTAAELGFSVSSGTDGVDVAGTIDGITAIGTGNVLTADSGSGAEGLSLVIAGSTTGSRGTVNFTLGAANQLDVLMGSFLDVEGPLESRIDSFQTQIDQLAERRAELELRWEAVDARYRRQFNALDSLLAGLQSTSAYMETQFANLVKPNSIKK